MAIGEKWVRSRWTRIRHESCRLRWRAPVNWVRGHGTGLVPISPMVRPSHGTFYFGQARGTLAHHYSVHDVDVDQLDWTPLCSHQLRPSSETSRALRAPTSLHISLVGRSRDCPPPSHPSPSRYSTPVLPLRVLDLLSMPVWPCASSLPPRKCTS